MQFNDFLIQNHDIEKNRPYFRKWTKSRYGKKGLRLKDRNTWYLIQGRTLGPSVRWEHLGTCQQQAGLNTTFSSAEAEREGELNWFSAKISCT